MFPLIQLPKKLLGKTGKRPRAKLLKFPLIQLPKKLLGEMRILGHPGECIH